LKSGEKFLLFLDGHSIGQCNKQMF